MDRRDAPDTGDLDGLSTLTDPVRRRLYDEVSAHDDPVGREDAARAVGISRTLAAYHLDRLVDAGLLSTTYARPAGAGGPGAGRPAKRYRRVQEDRTVSVPPRDYGLVADLLATAVDEDGDDGRVHRALLSAAESEGRAAGASDADLCTVLAERGYEPDVDEAGDIDLRNCPFHRLSRSHTALVCGLNHAMLGSLLEARGEDRTRAELCPREGRCCVVIRAGRAQA